MSEIKQLHYVWILKKEGSCTCLYKADCLKYYVKLLCLSSPIFIKYCKVTSMISIHYNKFRKPSWSATYQ